MNFRDHFMRLFEKQKSGNPSYVFDFELCSYIREELIPNKERIPVLYRYSPADYNNIRALERGTLFLSEAGSMNDVFEGLSCRLDDKDLDCVDHLHDLAFLKSFTENEDDAVMWGTYADSYAGICVAYDCTNCADESLYYHLFPVRYTDSRLTKATVRGMAHSLLELKREESLGNCASDADELKDVMSLFVSKSDKWAYEKEWRLIVTYLQMHTRFGEYENDTDLKELYNISSQTIEFPYAKEIFLGPRMRSHVKEHLYEIGAKLGIPVHEMMLAKDSYKLVKKPK